MNSHVRFLTKHQPGSLAGPAHPPLPRPLPPMPSRMGTMTRWTVVLVLAEVWRNKSDKVTLGNLARLVRSSSFSTTGRWAACRVVPCSHATPPCSEMLRLARQRRGAGRSLLVVWPSPAWGSRLWTNMAAFSSMAASLSSLARCRLPDGLHTVTAHHQVRSSAQWTVLCQGSLSLCVPGEAESEEKDSTITAKKPPSPPPPPPLSCHQPAGVYRYESVVSRRQAIRPTARFCPPSPLCLFLHFTSDLIASCRLIEVGGADLSVLDKPETRRSS